jgi:FkbM family methyltransferase
MDILSDKGPLQCCGLHLRLKTDGPLGRAGESILAPIDNVILPRLFRAGCWQAEEIEFIGSRIGSNEHYTVLDIGANIGLFSRQMINAFPQLDKVYCFEPEPGNFEALKFNVDGPPHPRIQLINAALGERDARMTFYLDPNNMGNYSLNIGAMSGIEDFRKISVDVLSIARWMGENLSTDENLIWKSDTQGYDELLITQVPWPLWRKVRFAIVELWRIEKPELDWGEFEAKLYDFPFHSWSVSHIAKPSQVIDYLQARDGMNTDLYMWR